MRRMKVTEQQKFVRCIDNKGVENFIKVGEDYLVIQVSGIYTTICSPAYEPYDFELSFLSSRFMEVKNG